MTPSPVISAIYIYPIKSCRGISLPSAQVDTWGLKYDRNWMVVKPNGEFITQRQFPRLALVETALELDQLRLSAPQMPEVCLPLSGNPGDGMEVIVWRDRCHAVDQGNAVTDWFSTFLDTPCRLVRISETYDRPVDRTYSPQAAQVSFADGFPLLMISEASLADLNQRLAEPLPMNRFRPNLVVSGCEPFAEDTWQLMQIGEVTFHGVKPCTRCVVTTTDQATAIRGQEPLVTLAQYRRIPRGIIFGQNLVHTGIGKIQVGNAVEILQTGS